MVDAVLVAEYESEQSLGEQVLERVFATAAIVVIDERVGQALGRAAALVGGAQQEGGAIGGHATAVEAGLELGDRRGHRLKFRRVGGRHCHSGSSRAPAPTLVRILSLCTLQSPDRNGTAIARAHQPSPDRKPCRKTRSLGAPRSLAAISRLRRCEWLEVDCRPPLDAVG
ncbi:MAG: hypothetical protein OXN96_12965 [Bryobacterales bacterium]|nr:hypothetical protein [Bryobacterales bacterium]